MSNHFVEPYDDMPSLRSVTKDDHGNDREGPFLKNLRDSLKIAIHDQQRLGQTINKRNMYNTGERCLNMYGSRGYWGRRTQYRS